MRAIGKGSTYVRFSPNPGFSVSIWLNRWLHWCQCCGLTLLKPGEFRRARGRKTISIRKPTILADEVATPSAVSNDKE